MGKKVVIITASPRKGGNSDSISELLVKQLEAAGAQAEVFHIRDHEIKNCMGCNSCKVTDKCVSKDDAAVLIDKLTTSDGVFFVAPVYFCNLPGTLKVLIDRFYVLFNPAKGMKAPSADRKCGVVLTYGSMPDAEAAKAADVIAACTGLAGFGEQKLVLCRDEIAPDTFANNSEYQAEVKELADWVIGG